MNTNLSEVLKTVKKDRNVLSKLIIWESGVSKSQFYRIINGEESPSLETKEKICTSLRLDTQEFDLLFEASKSDNTLKSDLDETSQKSPRIAIFASALFIGVAGLALSAFIQNKDQVTRLDISVAEDSTLFIEDVTIPDGTSIPVNTDFVKTWRVKNTGNVVWKDRYLKRITPASDLICTSPPMIPIPETHPGETIDLSVTFRTPYLPGSCRTDWKTSDKLGNLYFPDKHGLYSIVTVTAE